MKQNKAPTAPTLSINTGGRHGDVAFSMDVTGSVGDIDMSQYRQVPLDKNNRLTILEGEDKGHCHAFKNPEDVEVYEKDNGHFKQFLVKVLNPTDFVHYQVKTGEDTLDHNTIRFQPGMYIGSTQVVSRGKSVRRVID